MKYFIDTNVFLRVLIKEDPESFNSGLKLLEKVKKGNIKAVTSSLVLAEISWTLGSFYKFKKNDIVRSIKSIISLHGLTIVDEIDWLYALDLYSAKKTKLIDCLIASKKEIREKKWPVVTYDQDFKKLSVHSITPAEI
ncbi:MAG: PIN domain-containing protein [Patescibacteria group bacterium]